MSTETPVQKIDGDGKAGVTPAQDSPFGRTEQVRSLYAAPQLGRRRNLLGPFLFAYLICAGLIGYGIYSGGIWVILAYTRILDILINSGLVAYDDSHLGLVKGIPDLTLFAYSQEPIHWSVLFFVGLFYTAFYLLKMVQFHAVARFYGLTGSFGSHTRAYLYGQGLHRIMPYGGGDVAVVSTLVGQGEDPRKSSSVVYVQDLFVWFEIVLFTLIGIVLSGWLMSFLQMLPAMIFFLVLYFITRGLRHSPALEEAPESRDPVRRAYRALATQPWLLAKLCLISALAMFLDDCTPYLTSQAMSSGLVILHTPFLIVQGGVVAGYLASRIPITPNGIGQFEFGFCMALDMAGTGFATSMTIVIIDGLFRHGVPLMMFAIMRVWHGIETNLQRVLGEFGSAEPTLT